MSKILDDLAVTGGVTANYKQFNTAITQTSAVGKLKWNDTDGTLDLGLKGGNVTLQIGQETVLRIVNKTATNITLSEANYQAVIITGAQGQRPKVDLAKADSEITSGTTIGIVTETILINQEGYINTSGTVRGINTTGSLQGETWADGDVLYLSGTVAGQITNIKPIAPLHLVTIGYVLYAHGVNGTIFVKVQNGYELEELHNVSAIAPNNNEVLAYDTATLLWKPKTVATALGYTPSNDTNTVHITGTETITGTKSFKGTTASDTAPLGAEISATGSGAGWSGTSFVLGYAHTAGNSSALVGTLAASIGTYYQIVISGGGSGTFTTTFGGGSLISFAGTNTILATTTAVLTVTPDVAFSGTVLVSVKTIGTSSATTTLLNSGGNISNEFRASNITTNTLIGKGAGVRNITGSNITLLGSGAGANNTIGTTNTFIGSNAGNGNIIGNNNLYVGVSAGFYAKGTGNTILGGYGAGLALVDGNLNVIVGGNAGLNITTGGSNTLLGYDSGRFIADGITLNTLLSNSVFIGSGTRSLVDNQTNQIVIGLNAIGLGSNTTVIGNASTVFGRWYGRLLLGTSVDDVANQLQISGYSIATGYRVPSGLATGFLKANGTVDSSTYLTSVDISNLTATGTPSATTYLRGDNTWATIAGGGDMILATDQTVTSLKTFTNSTSTQTVGLNLVNNGSTSSANVLKVSNNSTGYGMYSINNASSNAGNGIYSYNLSTSSGNGIYSDNQSTSGNGIYSSNLSTTGSGIVSVNNSGIGYGLLVSNQSTSSGVYVHNNSTGRALIINNSTTATGTPLTITKNGFTELTITDDSVINVHGITTEPPTPASGYGSYYGKYVAGRFALKTKGASGLDTPLQNAIYQNSIFLVSPNTTSSISAIGGAVTSVGTISTPNPSSTSYGVCTNIVSAATANATCGTSQALSPLNTSSGIASNGGFFAVYRLWFPDANYGTGATGSRFFVGVADQAMATVVATENATGNRAGIAYSTALSDTNFMLTTKNGTTETRVSTGVAFAVNKLYDFFLFYNTATSTIHWRIDNLTDSTSTEGTTTSTLPLSTAQMRAGFQLATLTTTARNIRMKKIYVETDN
jgi:hypothetical protein